MEFNLEEYNCPICGWDEAEFDGTYYRMDDNGNQKFDLCHEDLIETGLPLPEEYYPKIEKIAGGGSTVVSKYSIHPEPSYAWEETWLCPHCLKEFTFRNEN